MARPTDAPDWATDVNFPAGGDPWSGQPNKVTPSAGEVQVGFEPKQRPPAEFHNYIWNNHGQWINYLSSREVFRETWRTLFSLGPSGSGETGNSDWLYETSANASIFSSGSEFYPSIASQGFQLVPGTANGNEAHIYTGNYMSSLESFSFITVEFDAALTVVGSVNVTFTVGLNDSLAGNDPSNNEALFLYNNGSTEWQARTADGSGESSDVTDVTALANTFNRFRIELEGSSGANEVRFYIDNELKSTLSTNLPAAGVPMWLVFRGGCTGAATAALNVGPVTVAWNAS